MTFHADPRKNKKFPCCLHALACCSTTKIVLCERDSGTRHLVIQTSLKFTVLPSCPHTSFQELFSYYIIFSLTLSLSKTFRGCVMSPLFFLPTFHAERPSLSLFSRCCHLSVIKWCRPFFGTVPCRPPHWSFITDRPATARKFLRQQGDDDDSLPSAPTSVFSIMSSWKPSTASHVRAGCRQLRIVHLLGPYKPMTKIREKPELNGLWHSWKSFTVCRRILPHSRSSLCPCIYYKLGRVRTWMAAAVFITNIPSPASFITGFPIRAECFLSFQIRKSGENNVTTKVIYSLMNLKKFDLIGKRQENWEIINFIITSRTSPTRRTRNWFLFLKVMCRIYVGEITESMGKNLYFSSNMGNSTQLLTPPKNAYR